MQEKKFVDNAITLSNLNVTNVLYNINLAIRTGSICGITGRSGSGKTTLLRCINLLQSVTSGIVHVNGSDLAKQNKAQLRLSRRNIGMVSTNTYLDPNKTVAENILLGLELVGIKKTDRDSKLNALLEITQLTNYANNYSKTLSKSNYSLATLAVTIVNSPKILLCDDITKGHDLKHIDKILKILKQINNKFNTTILLATKDIYAIKSICDHYVILERGTIAAKGPILDIFTQPENNKSKHILQAIARADLPNAIKRTLSIKQQDNHVPVIKIVFLEQENQELILTQLIQNYQIRINIIQAYLDLIKDRQFGVMLLQIIGNDENIIRAMNFLKQQQLYIEELGYADAPVANTQ